MAASSGNMGALAWLCDEHKAPCTGVDGAGNTVLHLAVKARCPEIIGWACEHLSYAFRFLTSENHEGITPMTMAIRDRYSAGVSAMCFDANGDIWPWFCWANPNVSFGRIIVTAYSEARDALDPGNEDRQHDASEDTQIRAICHVLEVLQRLMAMQYVINICESSLDQQTGERVVQDSLGKILSYMETQRWWPQFEADAETLERHHEESRFEAAALRSAARATEPAVLEWLLDTWKVDYDEVQLYSQHSSVADLACCSLDLDPLYSGSNISNPESIESNEWHHLLGAWRQMHLRSGIDGPLLVRDLIYLIEFRCAEEKKSTGMFDTLHEEIDAARNRKLRVLCGSELGSGGDLCRSKSIAIMEILLQRYNDKAIPSLDLLVRVSPPGGYVCDYHIPLPASGLTKALIRSRF